MFKKIDVKDLKENPVSLFGDKWALLTAGDEDSYNTMTVSWGTMGKLWNKDVCTVFVRPQRYTYGFMEKNQGFTLSVFSDEYKKALSFCGSKSGRDVDKAKETNLTPLMCKEGMAFEQAEIIINCKKLYVQDMDENAFLDKNIVEKCYTDDYHRIYVGEITEVLMKE